MQLAVTEWEFIEPYLPIGEYGPYPERLRQQFEGVIWRFKTGGQWREMPAEFSAWSTADGFHQRFGLVHVDHDIQVRTPKASFAWYRDLIRAQRG
ncbi:hypothetical protein GCM10010246_81480 [Streptomyces cuspidosporus]|uniref:Insertion element IS402-like domain-containing protein n=1 Tax=Streptomyces cuspidosporus TaxID=66882 RepID=A0ABN3HAV2_9ACTN